MNINLLYKKIVCIFPNDNIKFNLKFEIFKWIIRMI